MIREGGEESPRRYHPAPRTDPSYRPRPRCWRANHGDSMGAEAATGHRWGDPVLQPQVEIIRADAGRRGDERLVLAGGALSRITERSPEVDWTLDCVNCANTSAPEGLPTVCTNCGQPLLVRYPNRVPVLTDRAELRRRHGMWRFRPFLPLTPAETPVSLGEGDTPLLHACLGRALAWIRSGSRRRR